MDYANFGGLSVVSDNRFDTKTSTWSIQRLTSAINGESSKERVELPQFQRSIVWSDDQRTGLLKSLYRGFPVGSLLLFRTVDSDHNEVFQLVDGLQRTSTIVQHQDRPLYFSPPTAVFGGPDSRRLIEHLATLSEREESAVIDAVGRWMKSVQTLRGPDGFRHDLFVTRLWEELNLDPDDVDARSATEEIAVSAFDEVREAVDLSLVEVPVVTYWGERGNLPEIFELINSKGTKLNKYQIFAATWIDTGCKIENPKIREFVEAKYDELRNRGFTISGLDGDRPIEKFNLFEYLFGLGKLLASRHPRLFSDTDDPSETNPAAFALATVAHGMRLSEMASLPDAFDTGTDRLIDPKPFEDALFEAVNQVEETLLPYIGLKLNERNGPLIAHSEYQIASMVCRVMVANRHVPSWASSEENDLADIRENIPGYYLYDLLRSAWRGAGDSRFYESVWRTDEDGVAQPSNYYARRITDQQWHDVLDAWSSEGLEKEQRSRKSIKTVEKVFLKFVYSGKVSVKMEHANNFDIEHLIPVTRLTDIITEDQPGWPISHIGNLALFTERWNREKLGFTASEWIKKKREDEPDLAERLEPFLFCSLDDLDVPRKEVHGEIVDAFERDWYVAFLERRFELLKEALLNALP